MNKSLIIVALALAGLHQGVFAQRSPFVGDGTTTDDLLNKVLVASGGNPWALPDPGAEYAYPEPKLQPPPRVERPRYITQEELQQLGKLPPERNYFGPSWAPRDRDRLLREGTGMGGLQPGSPGQYGQGVYPSGSYYGSPYGVGPLHDPYGGSYNLPYGGILPFLY